MRSLVPVLLVALALIGGPASARDRDFGLGIVIGEPTGVSGKLWLSKTTAIDGVAAWSFRDEAAFHVHGDFLIHDFNLLKVDKGSLPVYYGIGGRMKFESDDSRVGARVPVGLAYIFEGRRVDLFFEIAPLLDLVPDTDFWINGGIGVRYFFP